MKLGFYDENRKECKTCKDKDLCILFKSLISKEPASDSELSGMEPIELVLETISSLLKVEDFVVLLPNDNDHGTKMISTMPRKELFYILSGIVETMSKNIKIDTSKVVWH